MSHVIMDTIINCLSQDYENKEIIVYDDCSTDGTENLLRPLQWIRYVRGDVNLGVGAGFNAAIAQATGDIIVLMCADDLFTDKRVIPDIVNIFNDHPTVGYVSRWYYQFIPKGDRRPVRAWRGQDPIVLANNPSGLAFRRHPLVSGWCECSNKMFIETSKLAADVIKTGWGYRIMEWDTVAVRVHGSTSTQAGYWLKRRVSSPVMDWYSIGGKEIAKDYVSLIQIKNNFKTTAVVEEIANFIKLRPVNLLNPLFWFFSILALVTPRPILRKIPAWYRENIGWRITKEIKRPCVTPSV
jgi:glycosyltransferase involved in cell wall biosynthesis